MKVFFDRKTFGFTQRALNYLRNALAKRINHNIAVIRVTTVGGFRFGFFIVDKDANEVVWSGDGFRVDGQGEGGRACGKVDDLFAVMGVHVSTLGGLELPDLKYDAYCVKDVKSKIRAFAKYLIGELDECGHGYHIPARQNVPV